jgi:hypothetical protein
MAIAVVPTASAPATHGLGFITSGRLWKDIGRTPRCRAVTSPPGAQLNTTAVVPDPAPGMSMRKA